MKEQRLPELALAGGAIRGWDRKTTYYFQMIQSLAAHYDFDLETPFNELAEKLQNTVLYGSGGEKIEFFYENSRGMQVRQKHRFEGVIPNLDRRYRETESTAVREELTRSVSERAPAGCDAVLMKGPGPTGLEGLSNLAIETTGALGSGWLGRWLDGYLARRRKQVTTLGIMVVLGLIIGVEFDTGIGGVAVFVLLCSAWALALSRSCTRGVSQTSRRSAVSGASTLEMLGPQSGKPSALIMSGDSWLPVEISFSMTRLNGRSTFLADSIPCLMAASRISITRPPGEFENGQRAAQV